MEIKQTKSKDLKLYSFTKFYVFLGHSEFVLIFLYYFFEFFTSVAFLTWFQFVFPFQWIFSVFVCLLFSFPVSLFFVFFYNSNKHNHFPFISLGVLFEFKRGKGERASVVWPWCKELFQGRVKRRRNKKEILQYRKKGLRKGREERRIWTNFFTQTSPLLPPSHSLQPKKCSMCGVMWCDGYVWPDKTCNSCDLQKVEKKTKQKTKEKIQN